MLGAARRGTASSYSLRGSRRPRRDRSPRRPRCSRPAAAAAVAAAAVAQRARNISLKQADVVSVASEVLARLEAVPVDEGNARAALNTLDGQYAQHAQGGRGDDAKRAIQHDHSSSKN